MNESISTYWTRSGPALVAAAVAVGCLIAWRPGVGICLGAGGGLVLGVLLSRCVSPLVQLDAVLVAILLGPIAAVPMFGRAPNLFWVDMVLLVLVLYEGIRVTTKTDARVVPKGPVRWWVVYILVALLTLPMALDLLYSIAVVKLRVAPLLLFVLTYRRIRSRGDAHHLIRACLLVGGSLAGLMLWSWVRFYRGMEMLAPGLGGKDMAQVGWGRSNYLASVFLPLIMLGLGVLSPEEPRLTELGFVATPLMVIAVIFTQSRGAVVSALIGLVFWVLLGLGGRPSFSKVVRVFCATAIVAGGVLITQRVLPEGTWLLFRTRITDMLSSLRHDPYSISRVRAWHGLIEYFKIHPILGAGIGNQYALRDEISFGISSHNIYLDTLAELGLAGFVPLLGILISTWRELWAFRRNARGPLGRSISRGLLAGFVAVLINGVQEPSFWGVQFAYVFWMLMAVGFAWRRLDGESSDPVDEGG